MPDQRSGLPLELEKRIVVNYCALKSKSVKTNWDQLLLDMGLVVNQAFLGVLNPIGQIYILAEATEPSIAG
jgi:hypothetical protein